MSTFKPSAWNEPEITGPGRTAHHEAGHSVMAMSFGFQVHAISAVPVDTATGRSWINVPSFPTKTDHVKLALVAAAGLAAEAHFCQISGMTNAASIGHYGDKRKANESMNAIGHEGLFSYYLHWANEHLIQPSVWGALSELVKQLPKEGVLRDPVVIAKIARGTPPFATELFEKKLRLSCRRSKTRNLWQPTTGPCTKPPGNRSRKTRTLHEAARNPGWPHLPRRKGRPS